jgi:hypothetical protein
MGMELQGGSKGLFQGNIPAFSWREQVKARKPSLRIGSGQTKIDPDISQI